MKKNDLRTLIAVFDWAVSKGGIAPDAMVVAGLARQRAVEMADAMHEGDELVVMTKDEQPNEAKNKGK